MNTFQHGALTGTAALMMLTCGTGEAGPKPRGPAFEAAMTGAGMPVGIEVYVQAWNPLTPDKDTPASMLNQPFGISGRMNAAWDAARAQLSDPRNPSSVPALLSKGGLIAKGVNLYGVTLTTNPLSAITLRAGGGPYGPQSNAFQMHWVIPGTRLDFRATTPDAVRGVGLSRDLDPKLSVQFDLDITLAFAVADRPGQPALAVTQTVVRIANPQVDSGNFSGDVVKALADFCSEVGYGRNLNTLLGSALGDKNIAADPQDGGLDIAGVQSIDVEGIANDKLKPLNADIARSTAGNYARVGIWAQNSASGQMLTLLFAPTALPLPPQNGSLSGTVEFDDSVDAAKLPASCDAVIGKGGVDVEVQTGPRKVLSVNPIGFGVAPAVHLQNVRFGGGPVDNRLRQCAYTLSGLVDAWPNRISFPAPAIAARGSLGNVGHFLQLKPDHWTSPVAFTAPLTNRNLLASASLDYKAGVGAQRAHEVVGGPANPGDPVSGPSVGATGWGASRLRSAQAEAPAAGTPAASAWRAPAAATSAASAWGAAAAGQTAARAHPALPASRLKKTVLPASGAAESTTPAAEQQPAPVKP